MATVNAMIAAAVARPPSSGTRSAAIQQTRWYARSTGRPKTVLLKNRDMTEHPPAGRNRMTAGDGRLGGLRRPAPGGAEASGQAQIRSSDGQAAAGAAVGARGRARPAASGSR